MDKITEDLGKLTAAVQKINDSLEKVDDRVAQCEFFCKSKSEKDKFEQVENSSHIGVNQDTPAYNSHTGGTVPIDSENSSEIAFSTVDVQREFKAIKESYSRKTLPPELVLNAERSGIKNEDKPKLNVLISVSQYSQTALKVLADTNGVQIHKGQLDELATCVTALKS